MYVGANGHHSHIGILHIQLLKEGLTGGVAPHGVSNLSHGVLYALLVHVYGQHVMARLIELSCHTGAEAPQSNNNCLFLHLTNPDAFLSVPVDGAFLLRGQSEGQA